MTTPLNMAHGHKGAEETSTDQADPTDAGDGSDNQAGPSGDTPDHRIATPSLDNATETEQPEDPKNMAKQESGANQGHGTERRLTTSSSFESLTPVTPLLPSSSSPYELVLSQNRSHCGRLLAPASSQPPPTEDETEMRNREEERIAYLRHLRKCDMRKNYATAVVALVLLAIGVYAVVDIVRNYILKLSKRI